jgi:hypothetical protein
MIIGLITVMLLVCFTVQWFADPLPEPVDLYSPPYRGGEHPVVEAITSSAHYIALGAGAALAALFVIRRRIDRRRRCPGRPLTPPVRIPRGSPEAIFRPGAGGVIGVRDSEAIATSPTRAVPGPTHSQIKSA